MKDAKPFYSGKCQMKRIDIILDFKMRIFIVVLES